VEKFLAEKPEEFLEYSDWMGIPIQLYLKTLGSRVFYKLKSNLETIQVRIN
jgi:hypothetical protein